ncbi:16S rRNA (guanine(527)-N(7))-methyltransferase RsmG [Georgenia sp. MJ170]|uniref:16S rRNA (guanine(527)-N(7))-methyltransferase RsmG n=1 Tax=Georgenia sunbinii TaxID=3117728 RepID=UPI002F267ED1
MTADGEAGGDAAGAGGSPLGVDQEFSAETPPAGAADVFGSGWGQAQQFAEMLVAEGELRGLIGPRELPRLWTRHLLNATAVVPFIPEGVTEFADIGSGAGFPGVIVALMRPDLRVHLIEPMDRRVTWLTDVVAELDLDNVRVHRARAEELHGEEAFEVVTARAVASLKKLIPWTVPLLVPGGRLVALKGERAAEEVSEARNVLRKARVSEAEVHEVTVLGSDVPARVVVAVRNS